VVSIAACSSSGNHRQISPNIPPVTDQSAQKIEANRLVLLGKAKEAGLSDEQATAYAEANKEVSEKDAQAALESIVAEIAAEKAEEERAQKIEANRLVLLGKAKEAGLSDEQATAYAEANKEVSE